MFWKYKQLVVLPSRWEEKQGLWRDWRKEGVNLEDCNWKQVFVFATVDPTSVPKFGSRTPFFSWSIHLELLCLTYFR